jgi:luciferase family oxidoreductase group 1
MSLELSILCQSPVVDGRTPRQAVRETSDLARRVDTLGYKRFWVSEHHNDRALAGASPGVMISHLASVTENMRIGSGGVLLPHHRPLAIAERFNLLEALFPGRIDLGLGRSGGSEGRVAQALGSRVGRGVPFADIDELRAYLGEGSRARPFDEVYASPRGSESPPIWILGSSPASARYAAAKGLPYAFGAFLDPRHMMAALAAYHQNFEPDAEGSKPRVMLAWVALCAETRSEAEALAASSELWFIETFLRGQNNPFPSQARAESAAYSMQEEALLGFKRQAASVGRPDEVLASLEELGRSLMVDEFMLVSLCADHEARVRSYRLLAQANAAGSC